MGFVMVTAHGSGGCGAFAFTTHDGGGFGSNKSDIRVREGAEIVAESGVTAHGPEGPYRLSRIMGGRALRSGSWPSGGKAARAPTRGRTMAVRMGITVVKNRRTQAIRNTDEVPGLGPGPFV